MAGERTEETLPPLYHACMANDLARVTQLLTEGADPNDGESVYHSAQLNRRDCLELLLAHGADLSARHPVYRNTPLYFLAGHRESDEGAAAAIEGMRWLLTHGADPNVRSEDVDETPLHAVARTGWMPFVAEMLIAHGADPDAARADGRTAYVLAVRTGNTPLAEWFSARGVSTLGVLPVDLFLGACLRADEAAARAQLSAHPDLLATLTEEDRGAIVQAIHENREASVRLMAALGFDLGWEGSWGGTALHHAAWLGRTEMTRVLLALGVPVDARDRQFGSSPIGWAAHGSSHCEGTGADHVAVTALLLDAGSGREASINRWGEPPESMASPAVASLLRARGFAP